MKEYALPGIKTREISIIPDERGFFSEALRLDWHDLINESISQVNVSCTYPNTVRAWHRHLKGQVDYFMVVNGALKICSYDDDTGKMVEIAATDKKPMIVRMPGHYWHGFKAIDSKPSTLVYFVNRLYDPGQPDEERRAWNDPSVVPVEINGNRNDPRVNRPWDWFYPAHK